MRGAAKEKAEGTYQQELQGTQSAEDNKRQKQMGLSEGLEEKKVSARQDKFAKTIDTLVATKALLAKGQVGNTTNLLVMDQARQGANYNEKIRQSMASMDRQYLFNVKETEAEYQGIRNRLRSNTINAYNQIPTTGSILLGAASSAFGTELSLENNIFNT